MEQTWILGIDTGGTYTDAVLFDADTHSVYRSAKSLTTRQKLSLGITNAISMLPSEALRRVARVSLSTTLATNACVERRYGPARLLILGGSRKVVSERWQEYGLPNPADILFLPGDVHLDGSVTGLPDAETLVESLRGTIRAGDCVAVAGMLSNRNPACEYAAAAALRSLGAIAICSRDVAPQELNYLRRAATALLNGQLIPVIGEFLSEMRISLNGLGITAPVFIVRSDGGLMGERFAAEHPVETLLCGPSASVSGVLALTGGLQDAVIADIGGTTTDLALIAHGTAVRTQGGADVGGYRLSVGSACMETIALGGDTRISLDSRGALTLGERRAVPMCVLASEYGSRIHEELDRLIQSPYQGLRRNYEFLQLQHMPLPETLTPEETDICRFLKDGPRSVTETAEQLGSDVYTLQLTSLEDRGAILRCGFTLTDVMHLLGIYRAYDADASRRAARYFTRILDIDEAELCQRASALARYRLYRAVLRLCMRRDQPELSLDAGTEALLRAAYTGGGLVTPSFRLHANLVCVGAPAAFFAESAAESLGCEPVVPPHAEVANAAGAAASVVSAACEAIVRSEGSAGGSGYSVSGPDGVLSFEEPEDAIAKAKEYARIGAVALARKRGMLGELHVSISASRHFSAAVTQDGDVPIDLGATVTAVAQEICGDSAPSSGGISHE